MVGASVRAYTLAAAGSAVCWSCGGGLPQLQPAQTLPFGAYEVSAGASGELSPLEKPARATSDPATGPELAGALDEALRAPGVAPWVLARIGLPGSNEASLGYSGRHLRLGGRHGFTTGAWALTVGLGASAVFYETDVEPAPWRAVGVGVDLPASLGWQSRAEVVAAWVGVRAAAEGLRGDIGGSTPTVEEKTEASGRRLAGGGFLGFSVGVQPIRVRAELSATFVSVAGVLTPPSGEKLKVASQSLSLTPAGSLAVQF